MATGAGLESIGACRKCGAKLKFGEFLYKRQCVDRNPTTTVSVQVHSDGRVTASSWTGYRSSFKVYKRPCVQCGTQDPLRRKRDGALNTLLLWMACAFMAGNAALILNVGAFYALGEFTSKKYLNLLVGWGIVLAIACWWRFFAWKNRFDAIPMAGSSRRDADSHPSGVISPPLLKWLMGSITFIAAIVMALGTPAWVYLMNYKSPTHVDAVTKPTDEPKVPTPKKRHTHKVPASTNTEG